MKDNKSKNNIEKRTTRSFLIPYEDKKLFESNFIENFYKKKKPQPKKINVDKIKELNEKTIVYDVLSESENKKGCLDEKQEIDEQVNKISQNVNIFHKNIEINKHQSDCNKYNNIYLNQEVEELCNSSEITNQMGLFNSTNLQTSCLSNIISSTSNLSETICNVDKEEIESEKNNLNVGKKSEILLNQKNKKIEPFEALKTLKSTPTQTSRNNKKIKFKIERKEDQKKIEEKDINEIMDSEIPLSIIHLLTEEELKYNLNKEIIKSESKEEKPPKKSKILQNKSKNDKEWTPFKPKAKSNHKSIALSSKVSFDDSSRNDEKIDSLLKYSESSKVHQIYKEITEFKFLGKKTKIINNLENLDTFLASKTNNFNYNRDNSCNKQENENYRKKIKLYYFNETNSNNLKKEISILNDYKYTQNEKTSLSLMTGKNIPNSFDLSFRREYPSKLNFIKQFKEDYEPIKIQKENEKLFSNVVANQDTNLINSKTHFIKKKQSAINIKRQCGVSYVVPTESKQLNVGDTYKPLGHLVYQGTYSINGVQEENILNYIENLITNELLNRPVIATLFESLEEDEMKEYLLYPEKRKQIAKELFVLNTLDEIWKYSKDKHFLCIHLKLDNTKGVRNYTNEEITIISKEDLMMSSDVQIGILFRKATCGIKSVLKLYKSAGLNMQNHPATFKIFNITNDEDLDFKIEKLSGSNINSMAMRMELYVKEENWKNSNTFTKDFLYTFISQVEERIALILLDWNEYRMSVYNLNKENKLKEFIDANPFLSLKEIDNNVEYPVTSTEYNLEKDNLKLFENLNTETCKNNLETLNILTKGRVEIANSLPNVINNLNFNTNNLPLPMYIISTRDCFVFDLIVKETIINNQGRQYLKKDYYFDPKNIPSNYSKFIQTSDNLRVGIVTYENFFSHNKLLEIERRIEETEILSLKDAFLPETAQKTFSGEKLKRTKFFFGSRYMWTKKQLAEPNSYVAAGIRKDVSQAPYWMKEQIEYPLISNGLLQKDFVNSFALNIYHDGSEGLGQHFDDAVRFKQVKI